MCEMMDRSRLTALLERVRAIEVMITNKEEELARDELEKWKEEKVDMMIDE